jgi:hypothetical protein
MKKVFVSYLVLAGVLGTANAQLTVRSYAEKTHISMKTGVALGYELENAVEFGGFFQDASIFNRGNLESDMPSYFEREFWGVFAAYPFYNSQKFDVKYQVRTGVTNGENFLITSSLLADFSPIRSVKFGAGIGSRNFQPTLQTSVTIKL